MATKKITDLQLRGSVSDDLNFPSDDGIQSYRVTAVQITDYMKLNGLGLTGMEMAYWGSTAPTGWVLASGRSIGNATSGATERANSDTANLFTLLWNAVGNLELAILDSAGVVSTRGASAAADFAANKRLPLPDMRGRVGVGKDDMGGTSSNRLAVQIDGDVMGASGGVEQVLLTEAQMPSHTHVQTAHTHIQPAHAHTTQLYYADTGAAGATAFRGSATSTSGGTEATGNATATNNNTTAVNASTGGGENHTNIQPSIVRNVLIKL